MGENQLAITTEKTGRGFRFGVFNDEYGNPCEILESSRVSPACIWLGLTKVEPKIMASHTPQGGNGWVPFHVPENVLLSARMHLDQSQVAALIPLLQHFVDTGYLPDSDNESETPS